MTILVSLLTLLALLVWVFLVATTATLTSSDAAGNGYAEYYAVFTSIGLWLLLAAILAIAGVRGGMSVRAIVCGVVLLPGSCAAAIAAVEILKHASESRWPIVVPILAPPLLLAYAAWLYFPAVRAISCSQLTDAVIWGVLLVLSLAPWPKLVYAR
jgi:hypothetical protein